MSFFDFVSQEKNIFLTGKAGTGKTYLINELKTKTDKKIAVTSTTGLSSYHIEGQTIHSFHRPSPIRKARQRTFENTKPIARSYGPIQF